MILRSELPIMFCVTSQRESNKEESTKENFTVKMETVDPGTATGGKGEMQRLTGAGCLFPTRTDSAATWRAPGPQLAEERLLSGP